jgi:hypothetical protein
MSCLVALLLSLGVFQAKADQESATLTRTASSGAQMSAQLSKDLYRSVPYQDNYEEQEAYQAQEDYTVDVPYQDTETYYENVPYQEQESYQDTETYYDTEYRCHNETSYENQCHIERLCQPEPGEQICEIAHECGTDAHGQQICKDRKVCHDGPSRQNCQDRNVCQSVPTTHQVCANEQVPRQRTVTKWRTVTKYRQEQRTRTVTKYRQETRTRTVTKYRTVTKCCVTKYRDEFDHTWNMNVQVLVPARAALQGNEQESFSIEMAGSEAQPQINFSVLSSIYGYSIAHQTVQGSSGRLELALAPKYNDKTLGADLITEIEMSGDNQDSLNEIIISDKGIVPRVSTAYNFQIVDMATKQVVSAGQASSAQAVQGGIVVKLAQALPSDSDYAIQLSATRSGIVLEKTFSFTVTKQILFTRWKAADFGTQTLKSLNVVEEKDKTSLVFVDEGANPKLATQYTVQVLGKDGRQLSSQVLLAGAILDSSKKASVVLDAKVMAVEEDLTVILSVQRTGKMLDQPVQFNQSAIRNFIRMADLSDKTKISGISIQSSGEQSMLVFQDQIKDSSKFKTEYKLTITRTGGFLGLQKKLVGQVTFTQDGHMIGANFSASLEKLGISAANLYSFLKSGSKVFLDLTATRKSVSDKKVVGTVAKSLDANIQ